MKKYKITAALAKKVLEVVDAGLVHGLGNPIPGQMCVEAAVAYAMGLSHTDDPKCVTDLIRRTKITINDSRVWATQASGLDDENQRRAKALRRLAIAQLGSVNVISDAQWADVLRAYLAKKDPELRKSIKSYNNEKSEKIQELKKIISMIEADKEVNFDFCFEGRYDSERLVERLDNSLGVSSIKGAKRVCEDMVQLLIKLGSPGTKYLYLTETPGKKAKKRSNKKPAPKKRRRKLAR